jgi:hypothetical protein
MESAEKKGAKDAAARRVMKLKSQIRDVTKAIIIGGYQQEAWERYQKAAAKARQQQAKRHKHSRGRHHSKRRRKR